MPQKGDLIKEFRKKKNITQTELAEAIGVSKQTMYKYENNIVTNIPSDKIELIAKELQIFPAELMGWNNFYDSNVYGPVEDYGYDEFDNDYVTNMNKKPSDDTFSLIQLTLDEQQIIELYRNYNDNGKNELLRYAEYLLTRIEYKKCSDTEQNIG